MSTLGVPIELQERILDCLLGDISTFKTCSFVCRAWRPTTRTHLFRRFRALYDADTEQDDPTFYRCGMYVEQVLHLAEYIREIDIQDEPGVLLEDGVSESHALCVILDRINSLHRISISTFGGGYSTMRAWRKISPKFRASLSAALHRSSWSLTHIFVDGFSFAVSDLDMFRGIRRLEYVGLERMGVEYDENETPSTPISDDELPRLGSLETITLYFNFSDPENGLLVTGLINALRATNVLHITNLRLGGVVNTSVLEALPSTWLSSLTHLGLELTNLNPTHRSSPLSAASIAKVPAFRAVRALELSLNLYPSAVPHDLSALEIFLERLLPEHRLDSIITTVAAHGPAVYIDAIRRHYEFCLSRADVVKVQWEDGKLENLGVPFAELFANKTMEVGKFRRGKWCVGDDVDFEY